MIKYLLALALSMQAVANTEIQEYPLKQYSQYSDFVANNNTGKVVLINKGSQQLVVLNNGILILRMKVIVGKRGWQTPTKETAITSIITNPAWYVPKSIIPEQLHKINKAPDKYKKRGYVVSITEDGDTRIKQLSGPNNVLGKVKFRLNNIGNIFMHDTSGKYLFKRSKRELSHGCIRLEKPLQLITVISNIEYKQSKYPKVHNLEEHIPVHIVDWGKQGG